MEAEITLEYGDERTAEAITRAVSPDNLKTPPGLQVTTLRNGKKVITRIIYKGKFLTFLATIDDLLFSVSTAEKTLLKTKKLDEVHQKYAV